MDKTAISHLIEQQAAAWMAKDVDAIVAGFDEDASFISPGGRWRGRAEIRQAAGAFVAGVLAIDVDIRRIIFDGRQGAVEWTWRETRRSDRRQYMAEDSIIFEVQNGLIVYWREYFDTAAFLNSPIACEFRLVELETLDSGEVEPLLVESRVQGFRFVDTLIAEYEAGTNRFDKSGEALYGVYHGDTLIAIGGLNRDPYLQEENVGRVRHLYVLAAWRRRGVGRLLVERIIEEACTHFRLLTLRTFDEEADRFYKALGFIAGEAIDSASHHLPLGQVDSLPATSPGRIKALGEIALRVDNLDRMQSFYQHVIGLTLMKRFERMAFFRIADGYAGHTQILALFDRSAEAGYCGLDRSRTTIDHIAFAINLADYETERARLVAAGVKVELVEHAWVHWRSLFVTDPEGNRVELVCYDESVG